MSINYNLIPSIFDHRKKVRAVDGVSCSTTERSLFKSLLTLAVLLVGIMGVNAQTTIIDPAGAGGFESGTTLTANGWSAYQSLGPNQLTVGTAAANSGNGVYVSNDGGTTNATTKPATGTQWNWIYRDVVVPAGQTRIVLSFKWKGTIETAGTSFLVGTSTNLTAPPTGVETTNLNIPGYTNLTLTPTPATTATYQDMTLFLPASLATNTTFRLFFGYNVASTAANYNPPVAFDNISLTHQTPQTITSSQSGNWNDPATWGGTTPNAVPATVDNVVIAAGHTVLENVSNAVINNLTINGTLNHFGTGTQTTGLTMTGGVTVGAGGFWYTYAVNGLGGTGTNLYRCAGINIGGNFTVDGTVYSNAQQGSGGITFNGTTPQTITAVSGAFKGTDATNPNNAANVNNTNVLPNLTFNNTSTTYPSITWNTPVDINYYGSLTVTRARIAMTGAGTLVSGGPGLLWLGISSPTLVPATASISVTADNGTLQLTNGFLPGTRFSRYLTAAATGTSISAGTIPTSMGNGSFPYVTSEGKERIIHLAKVNAAGTGTATAPVNGVLSCVYTDAATTSSVTAADGATGYTVNTRYDGKWAFTTDGVLTLGSNTVQNANTGCFTAAIVAPLASLYTVPGTTTMRILEFDGTTNTFVGTHQNGSTGAVSSGVNANNNFMAQRLGITLSQLTTAPLYVGISSTDEAVYSKADGNWNSEDTWSSGTVPTGSSNLVIASGTTVYGAGTGNVCKSLVINNGGTLLFPSSVNAADVTIGTTLKNNLFINNGTLNMASPNANLYVNGAMQNNSSSYFIQSAGNMTFDGNNGVAGESLATGVRFLKIVALTNTNISLTGGTIKFPHPSYNGAAGDFIFDFAVSTGVSSAASPNHTIIFGDGDNSIGSLGSTGFHFTISGNKMYQFGNMIINTNGGTNRVVRLSQAGTVPLYLLGDLTINANSELSFVAGTNLYLAGNLVNNGTLTHLAGAGSIHFGKAYSTTDAYSSSLVSTPSTVAQTISGSGVFSNNAVPASKTAMFGGIEINNTSAGGVTWGVASDVTVSNNLILTNGVFDLGANHALTLGTATAAGALTGGNTNSYIKGDVIRTIGGTNTNTTFQLFPVGITNYAPVYLAPALSNVSQFKVVAKNSTAGATIDTSLKTGTLATDLRWETSQLNGTAYTSMGIKAGRGSVATPNGLTAAKVLASAPSALGKYDLLTPGVSTSVYTASTGTTPNFIPSTIGMDNSLTVTPSTYAGFLSYAESNPCTGTVTPGDPITSSASICSGDAVTLSFAPAIEGGGVTYQWQSATAAAGPFTAISGATDDKLTITPSQSLYYRVQVGCAFGGAPRVALNPVLVSLQNTMSSTTGASRCGYGTVNLQATGSAGTTVRWYTAANGGTAIGSGATFTTPAISATTTYYAGAETLSQKAFGLGMPNTIPTNTSTNQFFNMYFSSVKAATINSVDIFPTVAGDHVFTLYDTASGNGAGNESHGNVIATVTVNVPAGAVVTQSQVTAGQAIPFTVNLGFSIPANSNHWSIGCDKSVFRTAVASGVLQYPYSYAWSPGFVVEGTAFAGFDQAPGVTDKMFSYNWNVTSEVACSSPRVAVTATVTAPPAMTISAASATICKGSSTNVTLTSTAGDFNVYTWSPSTGVTGNQTSGWNLNPTETTDYKLVATQTAGQLCGNMQPYAVTVNRAEYDIAVRTKRCSSNSNLAVLTALPVNHAVAAACAGERSGVVSVSGGYIPVNYDGTTANVISPSATDNTWHYVNVLGGNWYAFKATTAGSTRYVSIYSEDGTTPLAAGLTTATYYAPANAKVRVYTNILLNGCMQSSSGYNLSVTCAPLSLSLTWSPATGLFTDAALSVPYVANATAYEVYANTADVSGFSATLTGSNTCTTTVSASNANPVATGIATQPASTTQYCTAAGNSVKITVGLDNAGGTNLWEMQAVGKTNWTTVVDLAGTYSGATTNELTILKRPADGTKFRMQNTGGYCGTLVSNESTIMAFSYTPVAGTVALDASTPGTTLCTGGSKVLKCTNSKGDVQWQFVYSATTPTTSTTWTNIGSLVPTANYTVANSVLTLNTGALTAGIVYFRTKATYGPCASPVYGTPFKLTVSSAVEAGNIVGGGGTVCAYQAVSATIPVEINPSTTLVLSGASEIVSPIVVSWWKSTNNGTTWAAATGVITPGQIVVSKLAVTTWFKAKFVNGGCTDETAPVVINVTPIAKPGTITAVTNSVTSATVCTGGDMTFNLTGQVGNVIQWYLGLGGAGITPATATYSPVGTNSPTLLMEDITVVAPKGKFYVKAVVTSAACSTATTAVKTITVDALTAPGTVTGGGVVCSGGSGKVTLGGGYIGKIQWQYSLTANGTYTNVPYYKSTTLEVINPASTFSTTSASGTGASYIVTNITGSTYFRAMVKNGQCNIEYTTPVLYEVGATADAGSIVSSVSGTLCNGTGTTLTLTGYTGNFIQWWKNPNNTGWVMISGATKPTYATGNLTVSTAYKAVVTINTSATTTPCSGPDEATISVTVGTKALAKTITASVTTPSGTTELNAICTDDLSKVLTMGSGYIANTLQWQTIVSATTPAASAVWSDISGANAASYTVSAPAIGRNWFRVKLQVDSCAYVYSAPFSVWYKNCAIKMVATPVEVAAPFTVTAYPNPYTENFNLNVTTSSEEKIGFMVYDMTGRLLDQREVAPSVLSEQKFGDRYPTGVYNVIVTQGTEVKTLRMVKR